jgi:hypothetical protein
MLSIKADEPGQYSIKRDSKLIGWIERNQQGAYVLGLQKSQSLSQAEQRQVDDFISTLQR